jgi:tRNA(Ile)-lysidine synthase
VLKPPSALPSLFEQFDLSSRPSVIAAVSGGSDSTALLLLLQEHLLRRDGHAGHCAPKTRLVAVTVDHGLRASSAGEAAAVAELCAANGVEHRLMRWTEPKPSSGISAAAREARYRLLAQAAREAGTDIVFTGHTADDQAETVSMRKERGEGPGLSGMASATLYDGAIWLLRPLLGERRFQLREYLSCRGIPWAEDATNADLRFERPRVRERLKRDPAARSEAIPYAGTIWKDVFDQPGEPDAEIGSLLTLARRTARNREDLAGHAATLILALARQEGPGLVHLDPSFALCRDRDAALHALRVLLATMGGCEFLPPQERVEALLASLANPPFRGTLSRTLIAARGDGVWLARETRGLPEPQPVEDGAIWDGRFRVRIEKDAGDLIIAARRSAGVEAPGSFDDRLPSSLARAAWLSQPVFLPLTSGPVLDELPKGVSLVPVAAPYARFLLLFDIELAEVLGKLTGAPQIPARPFRDTIESKA